MGGGDDPKGPDIPTGESDSPMLDVAEFDRLRQQLHKTVSPSENADRLVWVFMLSNELEREYADR